MQPTEAEEEVVPMVLDTSVAPLEEPKPASEEVTEQPPSTLKHRCVESKILCYRVRASDTF